MKLTETQCTPDLQNASPLFALLPAEIRNRIFYLSLLEHDDLSTPVPFDSYGYRPGHEYRKSICTALLRTCKLAYLESHLIPVATTIHRHWSCWNERAPLNKPTRAIMRFDRMTAEQRAAVQTVQLFPQQYALEGQWARELLGNRPEVRPTRLIITVRHGDWWGWEGDAPLRMTEPQYGAAWRQEFCHFPALEEFVMELETLARRRAELEAVVAGVRQWRIDLGNGKELTTDGLDVTTTMWDGSKLYSGGAPAPQGATTLQYYVATVTWRVRGRA